MIGWMDIVFKERGQNNFHKQVTDYDSLKL